MNKKVFVFLTEKDVKEFDQLLTYLVNNPSPHFKLTIVKQLNLKNNINLFASHLLMDGYVEENRSDNTIEINEKGIKHLEQGGYMKQWLDINEDLRLSKKEQKTNISRNQAVILSVFTAVLSVSVAFITLWFNYSQSEQIDSFKEEITNIKSELNEMRKHSIQYHNIEDTLSMPLLNNDDTNQQR